ncbi:hypothetical protein BACCAP_03972 [Pseudoflavonifractor capillosus ATCC 29799]|uniref:Uncharacterized protein n=1 Tax=Pseudoflavonifractor capillosus ATCC 29799 TaxID=411467 RepID=A6P0G1_9FIRM|nr:hypothetical protein BACCAP_03972 [Pseudoflavonifractor capillosus ATCC 29799]
MNLQCTAIFKDVLFPRGCRIRSEISLCLNRRMSIIETILDSLKSF